MDRCPRCGGPLDASGLCSHCLLALAVQPDPDGQPTEPPVAGEPQETIGPYRILERLGEGGMGTVYLAEQRQPLVRRVALKLVKWGLDSHEVLARFDVERQALALMHHPGIAQVYDAGSSKDGRPYFVMEYVAGLPLTRYCDEKRLPYVQRLQLFTRVCHAVQHAHQKGVIHRDLKPSNILVTEDEEGRPLPKIIDFGVAKAIAQRLTERTLYTELGVLVGTPEYMSPEQAAPAGLDIDTRTDIYSLGVVLYELLSGALPFDTRRLREAGLAEMLRILREEDPPSLPARITSLGEEATAVAARRHTDAGSLARSLRGDLNWITRKALEKERARRYESASELARDLERYLRNEPVSAGPPSIRYRGRKFVRRHKLAVAAMAAVFVALLAGLAATGMMYLRAESARRETRRQLMKANVTTAMDLIEEGDTSIALLWLLKAYELADRQEDRELQEIRLASALENTPKIRLLIRESEPFLNAAYSPDGREILAASKEAVRIYAAATGTLRLLLTEKQSPLLSALWSRRGDLIATALADGTVRLSRADSGEPAGQPFRHPEPLRAAEADFVVGHIGFALDDSWLYSRGDNKICAWRSDDGALQACLTHSESILSAEPVPGDRLLVSSDSEVMLWDFARRRVLWRTPVNSEFGFDLKLAPDGERVFASSRTGTLLELSGGKPLASLGHAFQTSQADFSPDRKLAASGGSDGTVRLWNATTGEPRGAPLPHDDIVTALSFGPSGPLLATGTAGGRARVWRTPQTRLPESPATPVTPWLRHGGTVLVAEFSRDERELLTLADDGLVRVWNLPSGEASNVEHLDASLISASYSRDGLRAAVRERATDPSARLPAIWDLRRRERQTPVLRLSVSSLRRGAIVVALSQAGDQVATSADGVVQIWSSENGEPLGPPFLHGSLVRYLGFDADGSQLLTVGEEGPAPDGKMRIDARLWNIGARSVVWRATDLEDACWTPDASQIVTLSRDSSIRIWEGRSPRAAAAVLAQAAPPGGRFSIVCASAGHLALYGPRDLFVVDLRSGQRLGPLRHPSFLWETSFSADGKRAFASCQGGTAHIWDLKTGLAATPVLRHRGLVYHATASPDGRFVATGTLEKAARIWDARTGEALTVPSVFDGSVRIAQHLSSLGGWLVSSGVLRLPETSGLPPASTIESLARVLSVHRLDENGALLPLGGEVIESTWRDLESHSSGLLQSTPKQDVSWCRRVSRFAKDRERVKASWAAIAGSRPDSWTLSLAEGRAMAGLKLWEDSAVAFQRAFGLHPDTETGFPLALLRLRAGDAAGHAERAQELLRRWGATKNPDRALFLARTWAIAPILEPSTALAILNLARLAASAAPKDPVFVSTLAATYLRASEPRKAIELLQPLVEKPAARPDPQEATMMAILSLAHSQLGQRHEAQCWFNVARETLSQADPPLAFFSLEPELFLAEADANLKGASLPTPRNPCPSSSSR